jgi:hypothetical protein
MPHWFPRSFAAIGAAFGALLASGDARADDAKPAAPGAETQPAAEAQPAAEPPPKPTRRGGFTFGVDAGVGVASIVGYPNDVSKLGYAKWYSTTGARPAGNLEAWVGGSIMDWFTVSLGFKGSALVATDPNKAWSLGGMFHIEAFPLFWLGGHLRDLGVRFDAGLGTAALADPSGNKLVDGSSASIIGGGLFYEGIRAWKTAHGPFLMGDYVWSDTVRRPAIFLGWRSVLYTKP